MKNSTQLNDKNLKSFKLYLEFETKTQQEILLELSERQLSEYNIAWKAKDFIMKQEIIRNYNSITYQLEEVNVTDDEQLSRFLVRILSSFISLAQSYRHNSTCPFNNAINFARNEAILEVINYIQRYI